VWQHYSGEVGESIIFWCEISSTHKYVLYIKNIEIDSVLTSYSKCKKGDVFRDTVYFSNLPSFSHSQHNDIGCPGPVTATERRIFVQ